MLPTFAVFYTQKVLSEIFLLSTSVECIWLKLMKNKKSKKNKKYPQSEITFAVFLSLTEKSRLIATSHSEYFAS